MHELHDLPMYTICIASLNISMKLMHKIRPVESHSRAWETILMGPYHNFIPTFVSWRTGEGTVAWMLKF